MSTVLRQKLFAAVLFLCFGVLAGFSPLLHNHDLDLSEAHQDCVACQWSHSPTSLETHALDHSVFPLSHPLVSPPALNYPLKMFFSSLATAGLLSPFNLVFLAHG